MKFGQCNTVSLVVLALVLATAATPVRAQGGAGEKVRFTTVDGVELHGTFYASKKRANPTVLLLHSLGEDSHKKNWVGLAEELQKTDFNVLAFDFRGHGDSTDVQPELFWKNAHNTALVKVKTKNASTISYKSFDPRYQTVLVNDIAAAKAFLDRSKNDPGVCNTASFILVGAETGATLGALWLNSECYRYKLNPPANMFMPPQPDKRAEGMDTICGVWLTFGTKLAGRTVSPGTLLEIAGKQWATPMVFMYGGGDTAGKKVALGAEKALKVAKDAKYKFTTAYEIKDAGKLTGSELLQKALGTDVVIAESLKQVVEAKPNEWDDKKFKSSQYIWRNPLNPKNPALFIPAKPLMETNFVFEPYDRFLR